MAKAAVSATAALSICESLLLALRERGVLDEAEVAALLEDAAAAHANASADGGERAFHDAVAALIARMRDGGDPLRETPVHGHARSG